MKKQLMAVSVCGILLSLSACGGFDRGDAKNLLESEPLPSDYKIIMPEHVKNCLISGRFFKTNFGEVGVTAKGSAFMSTGTFRGYNGWEMSFSGPIHYTDVEILGVSGDEDSDRRRIEFSAKYDIIAAKGSGAEHCFEGLEKPPKQSVSAVKFDDGWRLAFPVGNLQGY